MFESKLTIIFKILIFLFFYLYELLFSLVWYEPKSINEFTFKPTTQTQLVVFVVKYCTKVIFGITDGLRGAMLYLHIHGNFR